MSPKRDLASEVQSRAQHRCEYCRMHESLQGAQFHLEHAIPRSRGGSDDVANLAWACPSCNLRKSDRIDAVDPDSNLTVPIFNPRRDRWEEHFGWTNYHLVGKTQTGRATAAALEFNTPRRLLIRQVESAFSLFPPS